MKENVLRSWVICLHKNTDFLKNFLLFSEMDKKALKEISSLLETKIYLNNYTIFFEGEAGSKVFFLREGRVKVIKSNQSGDEQILEIIQPGEVFGEVVLFGVDNYPATTRTMGKVKVDLLTRDKFKNYFKDNSDIGWGMLKVMARKLARSQHKIENLGLRKTRGRVANLLIDMLSDFGDSERNVILNLNQQELADLIGTSRETVSRTLNQFKREGMIKIKGNKLTILDLERLQDTL